MACKRGCTKFSWLLFRQFFSCTAKFTLFLYKFNHKGLLYPLNERSCLQLPWNKDPHQAPACGSNRATTIGHKKPACEVAFQGSVDILWPHNPSGPNMNGYRGEICSRFSKSSLLYECLEKIIFTRTKTFWSSWKLFFWRSTRTVAGWRDVDILIRIRVLLIMLQSEDQRNGGASGSVVKFFHKTRRVGKKNREYPQSRKILGTWFYSSLSLCLSNLVINYSSDRHSPFSSLPRQKLSW